MRVQRALVLTLFVPAIGLGAVGCSSDGEQPSATAPTTPTGAPSSEPPWGLNTIDMPDDAKSIQATFEAFPEDSPDAEPRETFDAAWAAAGGGWLFVATASSAEQREALANAFLEASSS